MANATADFQFEELVEPTEVVIGNAPLTAPVNAVAQACVEKLQKIKQDLKAFYVGASHAEVIDDMILALAIGEHLLMLGDPGLGKSAMSRELFSRLVNARGEVVNYFEILMNKSTDPSELAGPIDMEEYKKGTFKRQTAGMLPEAVGAFLDEIYKSNSVALNFLLAALNERKFHNGGRSTDIPLRTVIAASNEGPESDELSALHDRILFRHTITEAEDGDVFTQMLRNIDAREAGNWAWPQGGVSVTIDELEALDEFVNGVTMATGIFQAFKELREKLGQQSIRISPRRWGKCLGVLKGAAALSGRTSVGRSDFKVLVNVLAEKESDKEEIRKLIGQMANGPWLTKLTQYFKDAQSKRDNYMAMPEVTEDQKKAKSRMGLAVKTELVKLVKSVTATMKDAQSNGEDMAELKIIHHQIVAVNKEVVDYLSAKVGVVSPVGGVDDTELGF